MDTRRLERIGPKENVNEGKIDGGVVRLVDELRRCNNRER